MTDCEPLVILNALTQLDPYKLPPGRELDRLVHERLFSNDGNSDVPEYSADQKAADKVRSRIKNLYGHSVTLGETKLRSRRFFARLESGPSTSTEVLAESYPLAICRLALIVSQSRGGA